VQTQSSPVPDESVPAAAADPLAEIDAIIQQRLAEERLLAEASAQVGADRSEFSIEFSSVCGEQVRPPMEAIIGRLRRNGGGGVIDERPEDLSRQQTHRLTLWMSLEGEIGSPRPDRHPYFQLDADVGKRLVAVSEGDMWLGQGGNRAGPVGDRPLSEITSTFVTQEVLAILRRSTGEERSGLGAVENL